MLTIDIDAKRKAVNKDVLLVVRHVDAKAVDVVVDKGVGSGDVVHPYAGPTPVEIDRSGDLVSRLYPHFDQRGEYAGVCVMRPRLRSQVRRRIKLRGRGWSRLLPRPDYPRRQ